MKKEKKGKVKKKSFTQKVDLQMCAGKDKRRKSRNESFANLYVVVQD